MIQVGDWCVQTLVHGSLRLDGGAMFGSVPKTLWSRGAAADEQNRILVATRSLVLESRDHKFLVDLGCGVRWDPKLREIYGIETRFEVVEGITDVILTHLHFDHVGGIADEQGATYPCAIHHVSASNWRHARQPGPKEKASYRPIDLAILEGVGTSQTDDGDELAPGLTVHQAHGHTHGLQWVRLTAGGETLAFPSDLMPTSHHIPPAYTMGYDLCAERAVEEKQRFLDAAIDGRWIVVFQHDPGTVAARLGWDERGRPTPVERIHF